MRWSCTHQVRVTCRRGSKPVMPNTTCRKCSIRLGVRCIIGKRRSGGKGRPTTSLSSAQAEVYALSEACKDAQLTLWVGEELGADVVWPCEITDSRWRVARGPGQSSIVTNSQIEISAEPGTCRSCGPTPLRSQPPSARGLTGKRGRAERPGPRGRAPSNRVMRRPNSNHRTIMPMQRKRSYAYAYRYNQCTCKGLSHERLVGLLIGLYEGNNIVTDMIKTHEWVSILG